MDKDMFGRLVESMTQMNEIIDGERAPSREYVIDSVHVFAFLIEKRKQRWRFV